MYDQVIVYFTPDSKLAQLWYDAETDYTDESLLDYDTMKLLPEEVRHSNDIDFFRIPNFVASFNGDSISDQGLIGYCTDGEVLELFNVVM